MADFEIIPSPEYSSEPKPKKKYQRKRPLNKDEIRDEIIRCGKDPLYFIRTYAKIEHPSRGLIPFNLFSYQEDLIKEYIHNRYNVLLKARQLGISVTTAAFVAWLILFHRHKSVMIVSTKENVAKNLLKKVKVIIKYLPKWLLLSPIVEDNVHSIVFENGSWVKSVPRSKDVGRSEALSLLVIDEAAHIDGLDQIWLGLSPTLAIGGKAIALSSPNGQGNLFHQLYTQAKNRETEWNCMVGNRDRLMWWEHPEHDQDWFDKETAGLTQRLIDQEYNCQFLGSGDSFFMPEDLIWLREVTEIGEYQTIYKRLRDPIRRECFDGNFWVWKDPVPGNAYIIGADASRGDSSDYSTMTILEARDCEIVAEYRGKAPPDTFGDMLKYYGDKYNNAVLVIENNAIGAAVLLHIKGKYQNIYHTKKNDVLSFTDPAFTNYLDATVPGFSMNLKTRPVVLAKLEEYVRNHALVNHSVRFLAEAETFIYHNGRPEALKNYHDDLVISTAMACHIRDTSKLYLYSGTQWSQVLATSMIRDTTPINPSLLGRKDTPLDNGRVEAFDPRTNRIRIASGEIIDLWQLIR